MTPRSRRIAVFVGTAVLAVGAGIGVAASSDSTPGSADEPGMSRQMGPGGGGFDLSALADELGVSEARLQEAMQNARPADPGAARGGPDDMIETLADELGISADKVREAFESAMPQGRGTPPGGAGPGTPPTDGQGTAPPADGTTTRS